MGSWRRVISGATAVLLRGRAPCSINSRNAAHRWLLHSGSAVQGTQLRPFLQAHRFMSTPAQNASNEQIKTAEAVDDLQKQKEVKQEADPQAEAEQKPEAEEPKPKQKTIKQPVSWLSFLLALATGSLLLYFYDRQKKRKMQEFDETNVKYGPSAGKAAIGGPFKLFNHDGKAVTEEDFKGNWTLIYFGFTSCPDICPEELQKMMQALDQLDKNKGLLITPLFVSVDPERDTVEQVKEYVKEFHPRLIGLTGTLEEVKKMAKQFRLYYMKTGDPGDTDYLVDHSIIMYLMDKDMEFVKFFGKDYTANELADGIVKEIKKYKKEVVKA